MCGSMYSSGKGERIGGESEDGSVGVRMIVRMEVEAESGCGNEHKYVDVRIGIVMEMGVGVGVGVGIQCQMGLCEWRVGGSPVHLCCVVSVVAPAQLLTLDTT